MKADVNDLSFTRLMAMISEEMMKMNNKSMGGMNVCIV